MRIGPLSAGSPARDTGVNGLQAAGVRTALVIGAYGFIGTAIVRQLKARGFAVRGLGRDARQARRAFPAIDWTIEDLARLRAVDDWARVLNGIDLVVNCAGALQDGSRDALDVVHVEAIAALAKCCAAHDIGLVQISAIGADAAASTRFLTTKAAGDAAAREAGGPVWIIRPGLVIGREAYGGTMLLRMLAAMPAIQPMTMADTPVQTVGLADLADAVGRIAEGDIPAGVTFDLVEEEQRSLEQVVTAMRRWLGFAPARATISIPLPLVRLIGSLGDGLGYLGWRSPMRSTALSVMENGLRGDPEPWRALSGAPVASLEATLAALAPTRADRLAARTGLLLPFVVAALAGFWLLSGIIGLMRLDAAAATLTGAGWSAAVANSAVIAFSIVDIGLAGLIVLRRAARRASIAMATVATFYLVAGSLVTPELWADPLGPLIKIVPAILLSIAAATMLEER